MPIYKLVQKTVNIATTGVKSHVRFVALTKQLNREIDDSFLTTKFKTSSTA